MGEQKSVDLYGKLCDHQGTGHWLILALIPITFATIGSVRAPSHNLMRLFLTLAIVFLLNTTISNFGRFAMTCAGFEDKKRGFQYASIAIPGLAAVVIVLLVIFK